MKLRIKKMIWNIKKQKTTNQNKKKKKESKKLRIVKAASATTSRGPAFTSQGCQKEKRKSKKLEIALAGVAQWSEHRPANQRVSSWIPSQGTCLGCGPGLQ